MKSRPHASPHARAPAPPRDRAWLAVPIFSAAMAALWIVFGQLAVGTMNDDDISRYFLARRAFGEPSLLIHLWGRPLFMLLYVLPARLGYGGVEFVTAIVSGLTLLVTTRLARAAGVRAALLAAAFTAFQPFVFRMGYSALAEPLAALCLALALWLGLTGRFALSVLAAGVLPLARLEMAPIVLLLLLPAIHARRWRLVPLAAAPLVLWSVGGTIAEGDPFWLPNAILHGRMTRSLPPLPVTNYFRSFPLVTGGVILPLFLVGLVRGRRLDELKGRRDLLRAVFGVQFVVLVLLGWDKIPFGASIGYLRHFVAIGPVIGVLAAHGFERWESAREERVRQFVAATAGLLWAVAMHALRAGRFVWEHPSNLAAEPWIWSAGGIAGYAWLLWTGSLPRAARAAGFAILAAAAVMIAEPPMGLSGERLAVKHIVETTREPRYAGRLIAMNHPWFAFLDGGDPHDRSRYAPMTQESLAALPPGSLVAWDTHFSHRLSGDVPPEYFRTHSGEYRLVTRETVGAPFPFAMFLFEKVAFSGP